jgi:hypothetical protein
MTEGKQIEQVTEFIYLGISEYKKDMEYKLHTNM